jgi:o-succinylbenzoate synthase
MIKPLFSKSSKTLKAKWERHSMIFKQPAKTSRETFRKKDTYLIKLFFENEERVGLGECSPLWTLSIDPKQNYSSKLNWVCANINNWENFLYSDDLSNYPSIQFGLETALLDLQNGGSQVIFPSRFTNGEDSIEINGLIWMGNYDYMSQQIEEKIKLGFTCVKLKVGAIDWEKEKKLLSEIRKRFSANEMELRVDANGAFSSSRIIDKLKFLADLDIHSIEQPIQAKKRVLMTELCVKTPIPIALDEELIGIKSYEEKEELIQQINPQYIILKPSLIGGIKSCKEWIEIAEKHKIGWWATSALEGNIGLNAIAQFIYQTGNKMPQGLGTGQLFESNFDSRLKLDGNKMRFQK